MFATSIFDSPHADFVQRIHESGKEDLYSYTRAINKSSSPSMDLYYKQSLAGKQELMFNVVGTYIKDNANMFVFTCSWNFNSGRKHKAGEKTMNNVYIFTLGILENMFYDALTSLKDCSIRIGIEEGVSKFL